MSETRNIISGAQLQVAFQEQDWSSLWIHLIAHTVFRLTKRYGIQASSSDLKARAEEVVSEVVDSIFVEGTRKWYPDTNETLEELMYSSIDSHLYNTIVRKKQREFSGQEDYVFESNGYTQNAEEIISAEEFKDKIIQDLIDLGAEDDELLVFDCMIDGITIPKHIRKELGISEEDFHNIWRRLGRKRDRIAEKLKSYGR
jgi:hypothetical protein